MQKNKHRKQNKNICSDLITKVHIKCKYPTTYIFITGNEQMAHIRGGFRGGRAGRAPLPPPKIRKAYDIQR